MDGEDDEPLEGPGEAGPRAVNGPVWDPKSVSVVDVIRLVLGARACVSSSSVREERLLSTLGGGPLSGHAPFVARKSNNVKASETS